MGTHWIVESMSMMFLIPTQEFGGTVIMTISLKLVIHQKGFILKRAIKKQQSDVRSNIFIICCFYQNKTSEKYSSIHFQEFTNVSKINHMKKLIEDMNVFGQDFRVRQEVSDEIQTGLISLKMSFKIPLKIIYLVRKEKINHFG